MWPIDRTLTGTSTPSQRRVENHGNEVGIPYTLEPQKWSPHRQMLFRVESYTGHKSKI